MDIYTLFFTGLVEFSPAFIRKFYWLLNESIFRYPLAASYLAILYVVVTKLMDIGVQVVKTAPEEQGETPSIERHPESGSFSDTRQEMFSAVLRDFERGRVVTPREVKSSVFEADDYSPNHQCADEWWDETVEPLLKQHPDIEQLDSTARRWKFASSESSS